MVPLHKEEREMYLWQRAEKEVRERYGAEDARQGEILGQLAAEFVGFQGPLEDVKQITEPVGDD